MKKITILNGSLGGQNGNTAAVLKLLVSELAPFSEINSIHLSETDLTQKKALEKLLSESDAFVFATGTYWDSWGSPMQRFFEEATEFETGPVWLGKSAATLVTMHSVGGKAILSRLQGVLSTLGLLIPPMSGMVYSLAGHLALQSHATEFHSDIWQLSDLKVIAENLLTAVNLSLQNGEETTWRTWPTDTQDPHRPWFS